MSSNYSVRQDKSEYTFERIINGVVSLCTFYSKRLIEVDGSFFVLGSFEKGKMDRIIELSTRVNAVQEHQLIKKSHSVETWVETLLDRIAKAKKPIAEVIADNHRLDAKTHNMYSRNNLWKVVVTINGLSQELLQLPFQY
jgi:hypothetical protein